MWRRACRWLVLSSTPHLRLKTYGAGPLGTFGAGPDNSNCPFTAELSISKSKPQQSHSTPCQYEQVAFSAPCLSPRERAVSGTSGASRSRAAAQSRAFTRVSTYVQVEFGIEHFHRNHSCSDRCPKSITSRTQPHESKQ